jgi:hypothetical protein
MSWLESAKHQCYDFVFARPMKQFTERTVFLKWTMIFCILTSITSMVLCFYMYRNVRGMKQYMVYQRNPAYTSMKNNYLPP